MADSIQRMAVWMLILRIFAFMFLGASVALLITNKFTDSQGNKTTFKDIYSYRYVLAASAVGLAYSLVQLPFATYYAITEKRMIRNGCMSKFDFYGDKIISYVLATAVGAGFAVSFELKKIVNDLFSIVVFFGIPLTEDDKTKSEKFLNRGSITTGLLAGAFVFMAVVSVLSSVHRTSSSKGFFGK